MRLETLDEALAKIAPPDMGRSNRYEIGDLDGQAAGRPAGRSLIDVTVPHYLARDWVVTLGEPNLIINQILGVPDILASADVREAFAIVTWGSGGVSHTAQVDWRQGSSFRVFGSHVRVASFVPQAVALLTGPVILAASISPGMGTGALPMPTRTRFLGTIAAVTTSVQFAVPQFAYECIATMERVNTNDSYDVRFFRLSGTVILPAMQVGVSSTAAAWPTASHFPVPPDATVFTFTNNDALQAMDGVEVVFWLGM